MCIESLLVYLIHRATHIPVGEDQIQHLELARDLARLFNNRYGHIFPEPKPILGMPFEY